MQEFVDRHGLTFPQIMDDSAEVFARFEVPAQPAWVFLDANGTGDQVLGALEGEELDSIVAGLLADG